jgi:hypothetical protein
LRHRISATAVYELPFGKSFNGVKALALKGWQANAIYFWQSGQPFDVYSSDPAVNIRGVSYDRPNLVGKSTLPKPSRSLGEWFNTSAFEKQATGTLGNAPKNGLYGPSDRRLDLSFMKDFSMSERFKAQFRAECFNFTNSPNFAQPSFAIQSWNTDGTPATTGSYTFGQISATTDNPRQFQFAMKILF